MAPDPHHQCDEKKKRYQTKKSAPIDQPLEERLTKRLKPISSQEGAGK
jgi:hypothetical protein